MSDMAIKAIKGIFYNARNLTEKQIKKNIKDME